MFTSLIIHADLVPEKRIVGGTEVKRSFWPWMATLVERNVSPLSDAHFCGAMLIHPQWVLTAGHCVESTLPHNFDVMLNMHDLTTDMGDIYPVRQVIIHPKFDNVSLDNDIALIQLKNAANYPVIHPMLTHKIFPGTSAIIIGWGKLNEHGPFSTKLQQVNVPIISNDVCLNAFEKDPSDVVITSNQICAGEPDGGKDACRGDSGGPLIIRDIDNWVLAGIVSWGRGCARPGYYGIYTRVSMYIDFIEKYVPSVTITGQVTAVLHAQHSMSIPNALIQLVNTEYQTYTDKNGYYSFDVPSGIFVISIKAENFLPIVQVINLCQRKRVIYYNRILSKISGDIDKNGIINIADIIALLQRIITIDDNQLSYSSPPTAYSPQVFSPQAYSPQTLQLLK
ncbi:coagulation factor VII [Candidatus Magnetomorum sp. HK-1]|nr:coagulation factor VII [Candidatus Magnetomorum sp. HK-1]